jgi:hypothetical protein
MDATFAYPAVQFNVGDTVTDKKGRVVRIDGIRENLAPRDCYRCRYRNGGDQVVVLHQINFGDEALSVWWCTACVNNHFEKNRATLESRTDDDSPF